MALYLLIQSITLFGVIYHKINVKQRRDVESLSLPRKAEGENQGMNSIATSTPVLANALSVGVNELPIWEAICVNSNDCSSDGASIARINASAYFLFTSNIINDEGCGCQTPRTCSK